MVFSGSYFVPGAHIELFRDFQYTDQPVIISHSQEVLPGFFKTKYVEFKRCQPNSTIILEKNLNFQMHLNMVQ